MRESKKLGKAGTLLVALLVLILVTGVDTGRNLYLWNFLRWVYYLLVFCVGGYLLSASRNWLRLSICLAAPTFLIGISSAVLEPNVILKIIGHAGVLFLQALMILLVIKYSLMDRESGEVGRLIAGVCGYLVFALMCANLFGMCEALVPGGFKASDGREVSEESGSLLYFSLVTVTTLGYGDITPATSLTRILSALEAVLGSLYLVIFIASLIPGKARKA